jgi:colanic acid/amylovoran biosynthesis protein
MNILVSHAYSNDNKGDAAILSVLINDIKRAFDDPSITILTLDTIKNGDRFEGVPMQHSLMYYVLEEQNRIRQALRAVLVVASTLLWAVSYRMLKLSLPLPKRIRTAVHCYRDADLIIPVGGGYILSNRGFINTVRLFLTVYPFFFSRMLGKKTINYSQSVGPFGTKFQEWLAKQSVKQLTGIIVRESISHRLISEWHIKTPCVLSIDSGFSFETREQVNVRSLYDVPEDRMLVGVTVRDLFANKRDQERYEREIAAICDTIIETHRAIILFIPQVTVEHNADDDRVSGKRTHGYMRHQDSARVATECYSHHVIKAMYAGLDYLIGTRFHSVIFALTSYVPAIAIGYGRKSQGIMNDLDLGEWVVQAEHVEHAAMSELFDRLVRERESYLAQLHAALPVSIERSRKNIEIVLDMYRQSL